MSILERICRTDFKLTRRQVLIGAGVGITMAALNTISSDHTPEAREGYIPLTDVANLDFVSSNSHGGAEYSYFETLSQIKHLVGPEYAIPMWRMFVEFGPDAFTEEGFRKKVVTRYPEFGIVAGAMLAFASHGHSVAACQRAFAKRFGYDMQSIVLPVQNALSIEELQRQDELGNPSVLLNVSTTTFKESLRNLPNRSIINLSLQVGKIAVTHKRRKIRMHYDDNFPILEQALLTSYKAHDAPEYYFYDPSFIYVDEESDKTVLKVLSTGEIATAQNASYTVVADEDFERYTKVQTESLLYKTLRVTEVDTSPYFEIQGAYTGQYGADNIHELFDLAHEYPDKMFIAALGNYGDDLRPYRELYSDDWPANLIIAGHWDSALQQPKMYNSYDNYGADIYVDGTEYGGEPGSSMSCAVLSTAVSILFEKGILSQDIKKCLLQCCDEVSIETKPSIPMWSTDIDDYIYAEMNKKWEQVYVFNENTFQQYLENI